MARTIGVLKSSMNRILNLRRIATLGRRPAQSRTRSLSSTRANTPPQIALATQRRTVRLSSSLMDKARLKLQRRISIHHRHLPRCSALPHPDNLRRAGNQRKLPKLQMLLNKIVNLRGSNSVIRSKSIRLCRCQDRSNRISQSEQ